MAFEDRLDERTFRDDVEVRVALLHERADPGSSGVVEFEVWVSERLFRRMTYLGKAYELHYLADLDRDFALNHIQSEGLLGELGFIRSLFHSDLALLGASEKIAEMAQRCCRAGGELLLTIETP